MESLILDESHKLEDDEKYEMAFKSIGRLLIKKNAIKLYPLNFKRTLLHLSRGR